MQTSSITFGEADLQRLTGRCGWTADRAILSGDQLAPLAALVKHPMSSEPRTGFEFWTNEIYAQYVDGLRKRAQMLETLSRRSMAARRMAESAHTRRPKLSTLARDELRKFERALRNAERALARLSDEAEIEIRTSFWRNRFLGPAGGAQTRSFWIIWRMADDHFLRVQAACERMGAREDRLPPRIRRELETVIDAFDRLRAEIQDLTTVTRDTVKEAFARSAAAPVHPAIEESAIEDPLAHARSWLSWLGAVLANTEITVKKGRDEAPERALVAALAQLYCTVTGKEPGRIYDPIETRKGAEAGDFLALVRTLAGYTDAEPPGGVRCGTRSLSKIVREELGRRKAARSD